MILITFYGHMTIFNGRTTTTTTNNDNCDKTVTKTVITSILMYILSNYYNLNSLSFYLLNNYIVWGFMLATGEIVQFSKVYILIVRER